MSYEQKSGELMVRATEIMNSGMELVDLFVNKNYLIDLDKCQPVALDASQKSFSYMSLYEISKIVYDRDENINDKLVSVYSSKMGHFLVNILWIMLCGWEIAIVSFCIGLIWCITIIGIPFGVQSIKFAQLAIMPFGAEIVKA